MDYTKLTLAELLSHPEQNVRRNAVAILKYFQKTQGAITYERHPEYNVAPDTTERYLIVSAYLNNQTSENWQALTEKIKSL